MKKVTAAHRYSQAGGVVCLQASVEVVALSVGLIAMSVLNAMLVEDKRLRWSRGSVLAFGTQVRRFKPGRSRRIFKGK